MDSKKNSGITEQSRISKSTLSKTLRHCGGVDSETRHRILMENPVRKYSPGQYAVYCILPDVPNFFWKEAFRGMMDHQLGGEVPVKYNVYTKLGDTETVLLYLEEAKRLDVRVLIIAAILEPSVRRILEEMVQDKLVLFLSEQEDLVNSFYVGSDAYRDGYALGLRYAEEMPERQLMILSAEGGRNIQLRLQGFQDAVKSVDEQLLHRGKMLQVTHDELIFKRSAAANLAAVLAENMDGSSNYCLYIPWSVPQPQVAMGKLRLGEERIVCLCHDSDSPLREQGTQTVISCSQDIYTQGKVAIQTANRFVQTGFYPEQKRIFVPSIVK